MKRNRSYFWFLIVGILVVIFYATYQMLGWNKGEEKFYISVIVSDSRSDRWTAFKRGLNQGVQDSSMYLSIVSTGSITRLEDEIALIEREVENGADAVIAEPCADVNESGLLESLPDVPIVLIGSDITGEHRFDVVMADAREVGKSIAGALLQDNPAPEGMTMAILTGNQEQLAMRECLGSFMEVMKDTKIHILWTMAHKETTGAQTLSLNMKSKPVDLLITLDNESTELAVDYLKDNPSARCQVYGEGRSEKAVYYLDRGMIRALAVPNEYLMGYKSARIIAGKLEYHTSEPDNQMIDYLLVTPENVHAQEYANVLFPAVR